MSFSSETPIFRRPSPLVRTNLKFKLFSNSLRTEEADVSISSPEGGGGGEEEAERVGNERAKSALEKLSSSLKNLDEDFLEKLPKDLQVEVSDAGFALSSGAVTRECGEAVGEILLRFGSALEKKKTKKVFFASSELLSEALKLPFGSTFRAFLGKRLLAASRYLSSSDADLANVSKALKEVGEAISFGSSEKTKKEGEGEGEKVSSRLFKFGTLQVDVTPTKAFFGSAISAFSGVLFWQLATSFQNLSENEKFANENALNLAMSLRGTLLFAFFFSSLLSVFTFFGLLFLGIQSSTTDKNK